MTIDNSKLRDEAIRAFYREVGPGYWGQMTNFAEFLPLLPKLAATSEYQSNIYFRQIVDMYYIRWGILSDGTEVGTGQKVEYSSCSIS